MKCRWESGGRCFIGDVYNAAPFAIRIVTPDGYASHVHRHQRPFCVWHRHHVRPRHVGHFPVGGKDRRLRHPTDIEARSLQTVGYEFADRCFALVNRLSWLEYLRIVRPIRENSLDVLPFRCRLGPLGIPLQELLALNRWIKSRNENIR